MTQYKILLYLSSADSETVGRIREIARQNIYTISIVEVLGEWNLEVDVEVNGRSGLREILREITADESVVDYETLEVIEMPKFNFFP